MRRLAAAVLFALVAAADAGAGQLVDIGIRDLDHGSALPQYPHRGDQWVAGQPGHRYAVTLHNRSGGRVLAVLSVDGVNAISGQTASAQQTGYVLQPGQYAEIRGWRKNLGEIAEFTFTDLPDSYAARTGRPANVGVVGVAVYTERMPEPMPMPAPPIGLQEQERGGALAGKDAAAASRAPAPAAEGMVPYDRQAQRLGTGHGQRRYDPVGQTTFERATTHPYEVLTLRYDDYATLAAAGIVPSYRPPHHRRPDPFPVGFVPDPR